MDDLKYTIKRLQDELCEHRRRYYELNDPVISDIEYDKLYETFLDYENKYPEIVDSIGWKPYGNTFKHVHKMLSLNSTRDILRVIGMFGTIRDKISCEPKIDGVSLELVYQGKELSAASTRGDGVVGEDVISNVRLISIPTRLSEDACIYGEVYLLKSDFHTINTIRKQEGKSAYSNLRNAAAGILRSTETSKFLKLLQFFPYTVKDVPNIKSQYEGFEFLKTNGFDTLEEFRLTVKYADDIYDYRDKIEELREKLNFEIDGLVFKFNRFSNHNVLGESPHFPKWAIAFKFKPTSVQTRLIDVQFQVGKSGIIAPVAIFDPTKIRGSVVTRASLANKNQIKLKDIRIEDIVSLSMANDVIPYVDEVSFTDRTGKEQPIVFPTICPECQHPVTEMGVHIVCTNKDCPAQLLGRLANAVSRKGFNVKGLGSAILMKLIDNNLIRNIADIFLLHKGENVENMRQLGIGDKTINNILNEINMNKRIPLRKFIFALGITEVSIGVSAKLAEHYHNLINMISSIQSFGVVKLPSVNAQTLDHINSYFSNSANINMISNMVDNGVVIEDDTHVEGVRNVCVTGKFNIRRADIESLLRKAGFRILQGVSKNIEYLIVGTDGSPSKIEAATRLSVPILYNDEVERLWS